VIAYDTAMTPLHHIRIGSRRSRLAIRQAEMVRDVLRPVLSEGSTLEIRTFETTGDKYLSGALSEIGNKGLFTKEIEQALLAGEIDLAVHSMKDVATTLPDGLLIPATLKRDDVRDMLLCRDASTVADIPKGATMGTSSLRRAVQIKHLRPDITVVGYRGNVDRRIAKLEAGEVGATLLAAAGLDRLGLTLPYASPIATDVMLPAVAQGAIGLQCREDDYAMRDVLVRVNCATTFACISAERHFLQALDGSCRTPIAGYATLQSGVLTLHGMLANMDGTAVVYGTQSAPLEDANALALELANSLRNQLTITHAYL
jgi:hydroxymethylbilane synthase